MNVVDNDDTTPLHIAVNQKYKEIFQLILDDGLYVVRKTLISWMIS